MATHYRSTLEPIVTSSRWSSCWGLVDAPPVVTLPEEVEEPLEGTFLGPGTLGSVFAAVLAYNTFSNSLGISRGML